MKNALKFITIFGITLLSQLALGEEHPHGGEEGIPWHLITSQAVNFGLLVGILFFVGRKAVVQHFAERKKTYLELVEKADSAQREAEKTKQHISERLQALESSTKQSLVQAQSEAKELEQRILTEAKEIAAKLQDEAQRNAQQTLDRARLDLREEMLATALKAAKQALEEKVGGADQKKLQSEFVEKIQVVQ